MGVVREFHPSGVGGGSKPGKVQGEWPLVMIVVAAAVQDRWAGSLENRIRDRHGMPVDAFARVCELATDNDFWSEAERLMPGRSTPLPRLLHNRVYKQVYSGTSDRGRLHNPMTRAAVSSEDWRRRVPIDSPLWSVYDSVRAGRRVSNWKDYLPPVVPGLF